jgi:sugar phosphate isomerase/epimerase
MKLGLVVKLEEIGIEASFQKVHDLGLPTCHISTYTPDRFADPESIDKIRSSAAKFHIEISAVWAGWSGRCVWDNYEGPNTVGLVPPATRKDRCSMVKKGADLAKQLGVDIVITHAGFIPENPQERLYIELLPDLREIAEYCNQYGQWFCFETGQETPTTLLRTIEDVNMDNLGVNFDPANLILYGKASPHYALDILGSYIKCVHIKDGRYPTGTRKLGEETPIGEGDADIPKMIEKLLALGFEGPLTIEREFTLGSLELSPAELQRKSQEQMEEVRKEIDYLNNILSSL